MAFKQKNTFYLKISSKTFGSITYKPYLCTRNSEMSLQMVP